MTATPIRDMSENDLSFLEELRTLTRALQPITLIRTDNTAETAELISRGRGILSNRIAQMYYHSPTTRWANLSNITSDFTQTVLKHNEELKKAKTPEARAALLPSWLIPSNADGGPIIEATRPTDIINPPRPGQTDIGDTIFILSFETVRIKEDKVGVLQALRDFDEIVSKGLLKARLFILCHNSYTYNKDFYNLMVEMEHKSPSTGDVEGIYTEEFLRNIVGSDQFRQSYLGNYDEVVAKFNNSEIVAFVKNTLSGLPARLIRKELKTGYMASIVRGADNKISNFDEQVFKDHLYSIKFEEMNKIGTLELMHPAKYSEVGGFEPLKHWLQRSAWSMTPEAKSRNVTSAKGCALVGPPGTGKSLIAQTAAHYFRFPCIKFNVDEVFNKYVGESESRLKDTLRAVEAMAPCVLFIDEVDKVFAGGGGGELNGGVSTRIFGKLLSWMQDCKLPIFTIVTANRVQNIPSEFLRKGRLDEVWFINFPNLSERKEILDIHLSRANRTMTSLDRVLAATHNFSGAELEGVVKEAVIESAFAGAALTEDHIIKAIESTVPTAVRFKDDIEYMMGWARVNARPASITDTIAAPPTVAPVSQEFMEM